MLLAIDIGNSNISVGLFNSEKTLQFLASIDTDSRKTADQISIDLMNLFSLYGFSISDVSGAIFSSVVPSMNFMMEKALTRLLGKTPMMVGPGVKTGLNIRMEIHNQLGADLVAGAVAALEKYSAPIIMIDMGLFTASLTDVPVVYMMLYLVGLHLFSGVIDMMRALEAKRLKSGSWKLQLFEGMVNVILAVLCLLHIRSFAVAVLIYAAGLAWSGLIRIVRALRKTAIAYIQ